MTRFEESLAKWQSVRDAHIAQISKTIEQQALAVLRAIVAEVAGPERPYSADSYLPAHLFLDALAVIEQAEQQQIADKNSHKHTVEKADEAIVDAFTAEMRSANRAELEKADIAEYKAARKRREAEALRMIGGINQ